MKSVIIYLSVFTIALSSCTMKHEIGDGSFVQKRKYTKGFFVNIGKKKTDAEEKISNNENATNNTKQEEAKNTHELTVTASTDTSIIINETQEVDYFVGDCDEIILKNGEVISAKVTDVGVDEIKYKNVTIQLDQTTVY